jgi:PLP dependent protein
MDEVAHLRSAREAVLGRIARACARSGRSPGDVQLVAVSKTVPPDRLRAAVAAGFTTLGENRVQEAAAKAPEVPGAAWHFLGHLQRNKAAQALRLFSAIETVDSLALAQRLDALHAAAMAERGGPGPVAPRPPRFPIYLEVNVDRDPAKAGFDPDGAEAAVRELVALGSIEVRGLMTVGRLVEAPEEARPTFAALRALGERLRAVEPRLGPGLSMGMSDDFEVAVEEGATVVRIGRAIFGERSVR